MWITQKQAERAEDVGGQTRARPSLFDCLKRISSGFAKLLSLNGLGGAECVVVARSVAEEPRE